MCCWRRSSLFAPLGYLGSPLEQQSEMFMNGNATITGDAPSWRAAAFQFLTRMFLKKDGSQRLAQLPKLPASILAQDALENGRSPPNTFIDPLTVIAGLHKISSQWKQQQLFIPKVTSFRVKNSGVSCLTDFENKNQRHTCLHTD